MKRNLAVLAVVVVVIAGLVWAGVQNLRARRLAAEKAKQAPELALVKDGQAPPAMGGSSFVGDVDLRGKAAPEFTLATLDGKQVSLKDYRGKPVLINFWATWCAPCKLEMPWFEEFNKKYAGQNFTILGISEDRDQPKAEIAKAATKLGVSYPILLTDGKADRAYGDFDYLPMSFYVDGKGSVVEQSAGLGTKDDIEAKIKKTIAATGGM